MEGGRPIHQKFSLRGEVIIFQPELIKVWQIGWGVFKNFIKIFRFEKLLGLNATVPTDFNFFN